MMDIECVKERLESLREDVTKHKFGYYIEQMRHNMEVNTWGREHLGIIAAEILYLELLEKKLS